MYGRSFVARGAHRRRSRRLVPVAVLAAVLASVLSGIAPGPFAPRAAKAVACLQTWNPTDPTFAHAVGSVYATTGWQASTAGYMIHGGGPLADGCNGRIRAVVGMQIDNNTLDDLEVGHVGVWDMGWTSTPHGGAPVTYTATQMWDSAPLNKWEAGELVGGTITVGAQTKSIVGNTANSVTVSSWSGTPAAGSSYYVSAPGREIAKHRIHRRSFPTTVGTGVIYNQTLNFTARPDHKYGFTVYSEGRSTLYLRSLRFRQDGDDTTLTSALGTSQRTTLPVNRLLTEIQPGTAITVTSGANTQTVTATGNGAPIGATSISVASFTPNFNYPSGSLVSYLLSPLASWNPLTTAGMAGVGQAHLDNMNNQDGWGVDPALNTAGYMQYGPSDSGRDGTYRVVWQLKIDNNTVDNAKIATIATWTNNGFTQTGARDIYRKDFVSPNTYQDFAMNFVATPGFGSGYTVYWWGAGKLTEKDVSIWANDPSWMKYEAEDSTKFSWPAGQAFNTTGRVGIQGTSGNGNLVYSNPTFTVPGGEGEAMFTLALGGTGNASDPVAEIGVYNPGQNLYMGKQTVTRGQFAPGGFYQDFHVHFNVNVNTPVALYVHWYAANATLYVNKVVIHDNVRTDLGHKGVEEFWNSQTTIWPRGDRSNNPPGRTYMAESSIVSDGTLFYSYHYNAQQISMAISSDNGRTFTPYKGADPVIAKGASGWDSVYALLPGVVRGNDEKWYMVYEGSDASTTRIGGATSTDGLTWTKLPNNPLLTLNQSWETLGLGSPDMTFWYPNTFVVSYTSRKAGTADQLERGIATTTNFATLSNANKSASNPVLRRGTAGAWDDGGIGPTHGVWSGTAYYWVYDGSDVNEGCGLPNTWRGGLARSYDWVNWTKAASNPLQPTVPGSCAADVHLNTFNGRQYMTWLDHMGANIDVKNVFE